MFSLHKRVNCSEWQPRVPYDSSEHFHNISQIHKFWSASNYITFAWSRFFFHLLDYKWTKSTALSNLSERTATASYVFGATIATILYEDDRLTGTEEGSPRTQLCPPGVPPVVSVLQLCCWPDAFSASSRALYTKENSKNF
jgi:hypothetical protein